MTKAVEARDVAFSYGERRALDGVSVSVEQGQAHGFLGPNGSGKSTLFKLLSTIVPLQQGNVMMLGHDLHKSAAAIRREIGVVFQSPAVDRKLTVRENLRYGGHLQGMSGQDLERRIDELLEHGKLADRDKDRVEALSGGLRRRVEIMKALLHAPRMLLLDEASTGLDPAARADMWQLIEQQQDLTVLFTTHLMDEAAHARVLTLLDQGRVVAEGAPQELMEQVGGQVLEVEAVDPAELRTELQAALSVEAELVENVLRIEGERVHELVPRIMEFAGDRVRKLQLAHPSLEDVFLRKTGKHFVVAPPEGDAPKKKGRRKRR